LGPDVLAGEQPQARVEPGHWQAAEADEGWTLVSCIVTPAFEFAGFTLAPPGWSPG
jgi:predicted cupin superfamily sugar epimerase